MYKAKYILIGIGTYLVFVAVLFAIANVPFIYNQYNDWKYPDIIQNSCLKIQKNDTEIRLQLNEPNDNYGEEWFVSPGSQTEELIDLNNIFVNTSGKYRVMTFDNDAIITCQYIQPQYKDANIDKIAPKYKFKVENNELIQETV